MTASPQLELATKRVRRLACETSRKSISTSVRMPPVEEESNFLPRRPVQFPLEVVSRQTPLGEWGGSSAPVTRLRQAIWVGFPFIRPRTEQSS